MVERGGRGLNFGKLPLVLAIVLSAFALSGAANAATVPCPDCWQPAPGSSWQLQLRGTLPASPQAQIYVVDGLNTTSSAVQALQSAGAHAVCYLSVGVWEASREDANEFSRRLLGRGTGRAGERWLDVRRLDLLRGPIGRRLTVCARKGFDAVDPARVDGYVHRTGFPITARQQLRYNRWIGNAAHRRGLPVALHNDRPQARSLVAYFDFAISESCFWLRGCSALAPFTTRGKAVLEVEYSLPRSAFCGRSREMGFSAIRKRSRFGAYRLGCPPTVAIVSGPPAITNEPASFAFTASVDATSTECAVDAHPFQPCSSPATLADLSDGPHTFRVRGVDLADERGRVASYAWNVDRTGPETVITEGPPAYDSDVRATLAFEASEPLPAFECSLDAGLWQECGSPVSLRVSSAGPHTYRVRATDALGNVGEATSYRWTVSDAGRVHPWAPQFMVGTAPVDPEQALKDATHFDLLISHAPAYADSALAMKQANPRLMLYVYMNATFTSKRDLPETNYLHDADGNRIYPYEWPFTFLLDPRSPEVLTYKLNRTRYAMNVSHADGLFLDVTGLGPLSSSYVSALPIDPLTGREWDPEDWLGAVGDLVGVIKDSVAPKPVVGNGLKSGPSYFGPSSTGQIIYGPGINGSVAESWLRHPSYAITAYPSETAWKQNVDMIWDVGAHNASVLAWTKMWTNATFAQKDTWYTFAVASYLIANDGRSYFAFTYDKGDSMVDRRLNHLDLGAAEAPYFKADGVYQRNFTGGRVLVNPTQASFSVALGRTYSTLDGTPVTSVSLGPNSAQILTG
jgi:hypothetical protein